MSEGTERRLAAIISADVVGYSRLMGEDAAGTLTALRQLRNDTLVPQVDAHRGSVVKSMGDGWLVEFDSVVDAVSCAIEVQEQLAEQEVPKLRIGVHLGDIAHEDEDIYGDGVNIAARLQEIAEPGAIVISDMAWRSIDGKQSAAFIDLGEQDLKNITKPVTAYGWGMTAVPTKADDSLPLPDKPSIAVLPFENKSSDPDQSYFSDGLTENIIAGLTRFREILVIGVKSILIVRDQAADLGEIGRVLGVAHIVEGSVRKAGDRVRVTAQLVDAATGQRLWSEHYDRDLDDIFAVEDEITNIIVATLAGQIEHLELRRAARKTNDEQVAYDCVLRGRQCLNRYTKDGEFEARRHFERALELDPNFASAYTGLSTSFAHEYMSDWSDAPEEALDRAYDFGQKAVALDGADSSACKAIADAYFARGEYELAEAHSEKAIELNPNDYHNLCQRGFILAATGRLSESITCSTEAMRLNPLVPDNCLFAIGVAEYAAERYEEALVSFSKINGWGLLRPAWIAACYAQLGREAQAQAAAAEVRVLTQSDPSTPGEVEIERWRTYWLRIFKFKDENDRKKFFEGLRKAGLPA